MNMREVQFGEWINQVDMYLQSKPLGRKCCRPVERNNVVFWSETERLFFSFYLFFCFFEGRVLLCSQGSLELVNF
jgi:hypothetical protein